MSSRGKVGQTSGQGRHDRIDAAEKLPARQETLLSPCPAEERRQFRDTKLNIKTGCHVAVGY